MMMIALSMILHDKAIHSHLYFVAFCNALKHPEVLKGYQGPQKCAQRHTCSFRLRWGARLGSFWSSSSGPYHSCPQGSICVTWPYQQYNHLHKCPCANTTNAWSVGLLSASRPSGTCVPFSQVRRRRSLWYKGQPWLGGTPWAIWKHPSCAKYWSWWN